MISKIMPIEFERLEPQPGATLEVKLDSLVYCRHAGIHMTKRQHARHHARERRESNVRIIGNPATYSELI